ncbi:MAG: hypothetical protein HGA85_05295 [Nanoarchaeota archaeon]|nr:hypothetical protein [Nanoarchaeota archaeon]
MDPKLDDIIKKEITRRTQLAEESPERINTEKALTVYKTIGEILEQESAFTELVGRHQKLIGFLLSDIYQEVPLAARISNIYHEDADLFAFKTKYDGIHDILREEARANRPVLLQRYIKQKAEKLDSERTLAKTPPLPTPSSTPKPAAIATVPAPTVLRLDDLQKENVPIPLPGSDGKVTVTMTDSNKPLILQGEVAPGYLLWFMGLDKGVDIGRNTNLREYRDWGRIAPEQGTTGLDSFFTLLRNSGRMVERLMVGERTRPTQYFPTGHVEFYPDFKEGPNSNTLLMPYGSGIDGKIAPLGIIADRCGVRAFISYTNLRHPADNMYFGPGLQLNYPLLLLEEQKYVAAGIKSKVTSRKFAGLAAIEVPDGTRLAILEPNEDIIIPDHTQVVAMTDNIKMELRGFGIKTIAEAAGIATGAMAFNNYIPHMSEHTLISMLIGGIGGAYIGTRIAGEMTDSTGKRVAGLLAGATAGTALGFGLSIYPMYTQAAVAGLVSLAGADQIAKNYPLKQRLVVDSIFLLLGASAGGVFGQSFVDPAFKILTGAATGDYAARIITAIASDPGNREIGDRLLSAAYLDSTDMTELVLHNKSGRRAYAAIYNPQMKNPEPAILTA